MAMLWRHRRALQSHLEGPLVAPPLSTPLPPVVVEAPKESKSKPKKGE